MFNYTNTILINSDKDVTTGLPRWTVKGNSLNIKRVIDLKKAYVQSIYKAEAKDPVNAKVTFTSMPTGEDKVFRVELYIRLRNNNNAYYSNDMVFKGKPLYFEFKGGSSASASATNAANIVKQIQALYGDKYVKAEASSDNLILTATDEYQFFTEAKITEFVPTTMSESPIKGDGYFKTVLEGTIANGNCGFGTYDHIIKDLRLPTLEARRFGGINQEELPIMGAKYNQYTVYYKVNRGILGTDAVGDEVTSITTHVFYVNQSVATSFESALTNVGTVLNIIPVNSTQAGKDEPTVQIAPMSFSLASEKGESHAKQLQISVASADGPITMVDIQCPAEGNYATLDATSNKIYLLNNATKEADGNTKGKLTVKVYTANRSKPYVNTEFKVKTLD